MKNSAFNSIEDSLRQFLGRVCEELTGRDSRFLQRAFPESEKTFERLQLGEFCLLMARNAEGHRDRHSDVCRLFEKFEVPKSLVDDIHFVRTLRNKYNHGYGSLGVHSNEELADLLIIQRVVRALIGLCQDNTEFTAFQRSLDRIVADLVVQVAQATDPSLDRDEELNRFSEDDKFFIASLVKNIANDFQNAGEKSALPMEPALVSVDQSTELSLVLANLAKMERKVPTHKHLKTRFDALESLIVDETSLIKHEFAAFIDKFEQEEETEGSDGTGDEVVDDFDESYDIEEDENRSRLEMVRGQIEQIQEMVKMEVLNRMNARALPRISLWQARDELITLRKRIWKETNSGASSDGLLRKSMIDEFLDYRPVTELDARTRMGTFLRTVAEDQLPYLEDVCSITSRISE